MNASDFGPNANAPQSSGAIEQLEAIIGAPLSDRAKEAVEMIAITAFQCGAQFAGSAIDIGMINAGDASGFGMALAKDLMQVGSNLAKGKIVEGAYPEPEVAIKA